MPSVWFGSPLEDEDVALRVDRYQDSKRHRMSAGLYVSPEFDLVTGSLLIVSGHGKYLKSQSWSSSYREVSSELAARLRDLTNDNAPNIIELNLAKADLAIVQSQVVEDLKRLAGKYVDRILATGVGDPGLWLEDFDGKSIYHSMCDPVRLAELSGINVIDAFPAIDLENGGTGGSLQPLPLWLTLADRNRRAAIGSRVVMQVDNSCKLFFLPGSDGLDSELPTILIGETVGIDLMKVLWDRYGGPNQPDLSKQQIQLLSANGRSNDKLLSIWDAVESVSIEPLLDGVARLSCAPSLADLLRTTIVHAVNKIDDWLEKVKSPDSLPLNQYITVGDGAFATLLLNELSHRVQGEGSKVSVDSIGDLQAQRASLIAMLGFLNIDQMPANLPWITGCNNPRILGRITPGCPANWRQLLIEMADYRPPAMKLKDAI